MLQPTQQLPLVHNRMNRLLPDDFRLQHLFHRIQLMRLLVLDTPHLTEASLTDDVFVVEMVAVYLFGLLEDYFGCLLMVFLDQFGEV